MKAANMTDKQLVSRGMKLLVAFCVLCGAIGFGFGYSKGSCAATLTESISHP